MKSTVYKIKDLIETFNDVKDGKDPKAIKFELQKIVDRAPGSSVPGGLLKHHQGVYRGDNEGDFVITGSTFTSFISPSSYYGYFYAFHDYFSESNNGKDYWDIDTVMSHPSSIQIAEDILVIGNMQFKGSDIDWWDDRSDVRFYQITDSITELKHLKIERRGDGKTAVAVGLTKLDDQWILGVMSDTDIDFYSLMGDPKDCRNKFNYISTITNNTFNFNSKIIRDVKFRKFQNINLFFDDNDRLFLFGMPFNKNKADECWLFSFTTDKNNDGEIDNISEPDQCAYKHFYSNGTPPNNPHFTFGGCVVFEPNSRDAQSGDAVNGQFKVYSIAAHVDEILIRCNMWTKDL